MEQTSIIVIGALNTDIIASGIKQFPKPGEHVHGTTLTIGAGGKSRNIAAMAGTLTAPATVAMVGRTAEDIYGLWRPPMEALQQAGVTTDYIQVVSLAKAKKLPAVALIPVNQQGESQIIFLPGISDDFSSEDVDFAGPLFGMASKNQGFLALTLECPLETARYAVQKAKSQAIKVLLDPGGLEPDTDIETLLPDLYLIKPNEHEASMLSGVEVKDFNSARVAAHVLMRQGPLNVLITHGEHGAYLFNKSGETHLPIPVVEDGSIKDATGCGDQAMATLCVYLQAGKSLKEAAEAAVLAGTLQFQKLGIQPITKAEIEAQL